MGAVPIITAQTQSLRTALFRLRGSFENPRPFLRIISGILIRRARESFERERTPSGIPWKPLSPAYSFWKRTIARKGNQGILRLNGTLFNSLDRGIRGDRAFVLARARHAITHQEGRVFPPMFIRPKKAKALRFFLADGTVVFSKGHQIGARRVPARPFMGFSLADQREAATTIETTLEDLA